MRREAILNVPYEEKDQAKELGAWWDPDLRKWFVPSGKDVSLFARWLPENEEEPFRRKKVRVSQP